MVAGQGMGGCGNFGLPVVDSKSAPGFVQVWYYPIGDTKGLDVYAPLLACVQERGLAGCRHLAQLWANTSTAVAA